MIAETPISIVEERGDTAKRLVAAARRLFAQRGYDGASVRAITRAAGANLGSVTYHFRSKRALYEAVVEDCLRPLRERVLEVAVRPGSPLDRIESLLRVFFDHLKAAPDAPQFLLQEVAAGETPSPPVRNTIEQVLGTLAALIAEGQRDGSLRQADPHLTAVSIVAQPVHLTLLGQLLSRRSDLGALPPLNRDDIETHAVGFVRAALQIDSGQHDSTEIDSEENR